MNNKLTTILEGSGLDENKSQTILDSFTELFKSARHWEEKAKAIIITNASQTVEMRDARLARLALKKIRVDADKVRKELKEQSQREGNAIQGIYNVIKAVVVPLEEYLEEQENFVKNQEQERLDKLVADRLSKLIKYVEEPDVMYNLREMTDDQFDTILKSAKSVYEQAEAKKKEIEAERVKEEKCKEKEAEENRVENIRLKKEADKREAEMEKERIKAETKQIKADKIAQEAREAQEKAEEKLKEERAAKRRKAKKEQERIQVEKDAENELERQAQLAPEKEKLEKYAQSIRDIPALSPFGLSDEGKDILETTEMRILQTADELSDRIKKL